jgi:hypothetical protein
MMHKEVRVDRERRILEEVDKTLHALDAVPGLDANPFLFTRIQARLSSDGHAAATHRIESARLKQIALTAIVLLNLLTAVHFFGARKSANEKVLLINSLRTEYETPTNDFLTDH